jgi:type II secretory pathway component PulC
MEMIDTNFIRTKRLQQTFANMPASARQAYDEANRRLSQSIKNAEQGDQSPEVVERRKSSASIVVNTAILVSPERARANIAKAYEEHENKRGEVVDALGAAIERVRGDKARPETKPDARRATTDTAGSIR